MMGNYKIAYGAVTQVAALFIFPLQPTIGYAKSRAHHRAGAHIARAEKFYISGSYYHGKGKVQPFETALQHRDDWSRGSWEDVADGGDHEGAR